MLVHDSYLRMYTFTHLPIFCSLQVSLPPSDGIEIVEEEYEYPEKDADASEGWVDIRGEFQSY